MQRFGTNASRILALVVVVVLAVFVVENLFQVRAQFLGLAFTANLWWIVVGAALLGLPAPSCCWRLVAWPLAGATAPSCVSRHITNSTPSGANTLPVPAGMKSAQPSLLRTSACRRSRISR